MQQPIPTATNIKCENADDTQYGATINGKTRSGITEQTRFWASVQKAIADGAVVAEYVESVMPTTEEIELDQLKKRFWPMFVDICINLRDNPTLNVSALPAKTRADFIRLQELVGG